MSDGASLASSPSETHPIPSIGLDNILGANTTCQGILRSDGNIRIDGVYQGRIETAGNVIVGPAARVFAGIVANTVQVWGAVRGDIAARGRLEILPGGRVWGDVHVSSLLIDEGGVFRGECVIEGEVKGAPAADDDGAQQRTLAAPARERREASDARTLYAVPRRDTPRGSG